MKVTLLLLVSAGLIASDRAFAAELREPARGGPASWEMLSPPLRHAHTVVYDSKRDRILMFGGTDGTVRNDTWELSLKGDLRWELLSTVGEPPPALSYHSAIYDPARDRMIVLGGLENADSSMWALSFADGNRWSRLEPTGDRPGVSVAGQALYDTHRGRMIFLSMLPARDLKSTLYSCEFVGTRSCRWTRLPIEGFNPLPLFSPALVYDSVTDALVLFGGAKYHKDGFGEISLNFKNDAWSLPLADTLRWIEMKPSGELPSARVVPLAVFDSHREALVVWGVGGQFRSNGTSWVLSLAGVPSWERSAGDSSLMPPIEAAAAFDPRRGRMLVIAGLKSGDYSSGLWALDSATHDGWVSLDIRDEPPPGRRGQSMIFDPVRHRFILFGGTAPNDLWTFDLRGQPSWKELPASGDSPPSVSGHTAIYDSENDAMIVFGGSSSGHAVSDVWSLSLRGRSVWTHLHPDGVTPAPRRSHQAIYDPLGRRMIVYGGFASFGPTSDVWELVLRPSPRWNQLFPQGTSPGDSRCSYSRLRREAPAGDSLWWGFRDSFRGGRPLGARSRVGPLVGEASRQRWTGRTGLRARRRARSGHRPNDGFRWVGVGKG